MLCMGIVSGILLACAYHDHLMAGRQADEEALAEVEELYAAWAALRDHAGRGR
jgi:hypothetical protein